MGSFRITVNAVGGHGCQRHVKDGELVQKQCDYPACPDCSARKFVAELKKFGWNVESATLEHWPGTPSQVTDNLITLERKGNF